MEIINYKNKYLKYKNKYNTLKVLYGGVLPAPNPSEIKILTWNVLESELCNKHTFFDIFKGMNEKDVSDFNIKREKRIIEIIISKLSEGTILCLQEVNPRFHSNIMKALHGKKIYNVYGEGHPNPATNSQQGSLILSPFIITSPRVIYPNNQIMTSRQSNPIVCGEINGVIIINTHYFSGGPASLTNYNFLRCNQTLSINNYIQEQPPDKKIIFCSDFNRYLENYKKLFNNRLTLINSPKHKINAIDTYYYNTIPFTTEILEEINTHIRKQIAKLEGIELDPDKHIITSIARRDISNEIKEIMGEDFVQEYLYSKVMGMGDNCIDGIWSNLIPRSVMEQPSITNAAGNAMYPTLDPSGSPSDHLYIEVLFDIPTTPSALASE
jgi:hypothetical protein